MERQSNDADWSARSNKGRGKPHRFITPPRCGWARSRRAEPMGEGTLRGTLTSAIPAALGLAVFASLGAGDGPPSRQIPSGASDSLPPALPSEVRPPEPASNRTPSRDQQRAAGGGRGVLRPPTRCRDAGHRTRSGRQRRSSGGHHGYVRHIVRRELASSGSAHAVSPPSTTNTCPVTKDESSDAR
jgi:hypothetical protein